MKKLFVLALCLMTFVSLSSCSNQTKAEKMGWKLAMQSYSFHDFTLVETLDKCNELGLKYIEVFHFHKIGGKWGDVALFDLDPAAQKELAEYAVSKGVKIVASGVFTGTTEQEWRQFFEMAHNMGMEYVTAEPPLDMWDLVEELSNKYQLKVAVHNHPKPSDYWNPDFLLAAVGSRSKDLGSCADVGHWNRCGLDQLECLRKLNGRLISFHFKDIVSKEEGEQHDCIWGEGCLNVPEMLNILREQNFKGYIGIEYEYNWDNSVPDIKKCIENFNQMVNKM